MSHVWSRRVMFRRYTLTDKPPWCCHLWGTGAIFDHRLTWCWKRGPLDVINVMLIRNILWMSNCPAPDMTNAALHQPTITQLKYKRSGAVLCSDASRYPCRACCKTSHEHRISVLELLLSFAVNWWVCWEDIWERLPCPRWVLWGCPLLRQAFVMCPRFPQAW